MLKFLGKYNKMCWGKKTLLVLYLVIACSVFASAQDKVEQDKYFPGKIRGGFLNKHDIALVPRMKQSGMNLVMPLFQATNAPLKLYQFKSIEKWAGVCQEYGLKFMPVINFWDKHEKTWIQPHHYLYYGGLKYSQTPCPLDIEVYEQSIHNRLLELARLSRKLNIAGGIIDVEMYGGDRRSFPELCLCDNCFEKFLSGRRVPKPILEHERYEYLKRTSQLDDYKVFMEEYIAKLARRTKEQVETVAPDFLIGVLRLDDNITFNKGLAKGFGSGDKPVLAFTEQTYRKGSQPYIQETIQRFRDEGINANLVVGIWQDKFPVENLPEQYYHCARSSSGYWIYTLLSLHGRKENPLPFPRSQYWQAIRRANAELDLLAINSNYQSGLQVRPFRVPRRINPEDVNRLRYVKPSVTPAIPTKPLTFRGSNMLVFIAQQGEKLEFEIKFIKVSRYEGDVAELALRRDGGTVLTMDEATAERNGVLTATAPYTGVYALTLDSKYHLVEVVKNSHPYSIDTSREAHLMYLRNRSLYLWKPANCVSAQVILVAPQYSPESYTAVFCDESGQVLGKYDVIRNRKKVHIQFKRKPLGEIMELKFKPLPGNNVGDVFIEIKSGFGKYISPTKSGLVHIVESPSRIGRRYGGQYK